MPEEDGIRRRRTSGVLDAIFDAVEEKPSIPAAGASPFRAAALARLNVPQQVDNLLPVVSRRTWLAVVGVALVIVAFLVYAAATTTTTAVSATGRAVAGGGVVQVVSPSAGVIASVVVQEGAPVSAGDDIATGSDPAGAAFTVRSPVEGTVWQQLVLAGGQVAAGSSVATVLPAGSEQSVLVALPEEEAARIGGALRVDLTTPDHGVVEARVVSTTAAPVPAEVAMARTAVPIEPVSQMVMIELKPDVALTPGSEIGVSFVLSESTLLQGMLGIS